MTIRIPAEWEPHACCWMAWAVRAERGKAANKVKRELSEIVQAIARYEPVRILTPRGNTLREAQHEFSACSNVTVIDAPVDDIWMRDIAPTFALRSNGPDRKVIAIDWNFNGWGGTKERLPRHGDKLARQANSIFGTSRVSVPFVAEGGALITDGKGTLITTRSCLLNPNRNPMVRGKDRQRWIELALAKLGVRTVIWLEGDPSEPITSGHVDGYVMFTAPGTVLVESLEDKQCEPPPLREHDIATLEHTQDASGRKIKVEQVRASRKRHWKFRGPYWAPCYLNAYVANGGVITASFGDAERDDAAKDALKLAFPGRDVIMLRIDHIANGGGGIHCLTQPMPAI
jgi:agmatine deiminase